MAVRCDIFCTVIDNFGDLGVCWRIARQLSTEHEVSVTLWVDDLVSFQLLAPSLNPNLAEQALDAITVRHWHDNAAWPAPANLVIEGFGCHLPEAYVLAMAQAVRPPVWINLEYLSAEAWVENCHGMTSTHPQLGLNKTFWFPGFNPRTGGLLREASLITRLDYVARDGGRQISLFSYENPAIAGLLDALAADTVATTLYVFQGRALPVVQAWVGHTLTTPYQRGNLTIKVLPMLPHVEFDELLARCDLNLIRGEDSFVRALWAGKTLLWHIYPQSELAHADKLQAFIQAVLTHTDMPDIWQSTMLGWNQLAPAATLDWPAFLQALPQMQKAMLQWREYLLQQPDLTTQLMRFYTNQVESSPNSVHTGKHTS
ncbi:MAG: elongation factor P maturation arginine rhamnosyltransferase EarP [Moraxellaceae bacterium]|nr:elongation factor P maturation arginine rhamnosyltransferase EarP [Moraxellaceae bacterium]